MKCLFMLYSESRLMKLVVVVVLIVLKWFWIIGDVCLRILMLVVML